MSGAEVTRILNEKTKDQEETAQSPEKISISERSCMLDSFSLRCQENGSRALDDKTDDVDKFATNFSSSRWGVGISSGIPCSSFSASISPKARPPSLTVSLSPEAGLMAPGTSRSVKTGSSVPDVATSPKAGPSDLDDSAPPKARLSDPDASASSKAGSFLQDTNAKSPILTALLSAKSKPSTSMETYATPTFIDATPLEAGSSTGLKLVIFSPTIRKAHNWKNQVGSARTRNSFTEAKSALEGGRQFPHDKEGKPCEQHKVHRFRTTDEKSVVSHVLQTSSASDRIPPSTSTSASSTVGCIPRNTGKQSFGSLRSFLPQWIFIKKVPSQEPETSSVSPAQQELLNEAFNRRLFEDEKTQTGSLISTEQSSPLCGVGECPSAVETQESSPNEDKMSLEEKVAEDDEKPHETEDEREKRNTRKK